MNQSAKRLTLYDVFCLFPQILEYVCKRDGVTESCESFLKFCNHARESIK